jgi:galactoside 2-L-fucosyltransferase 1/2
MIWFAVETITRQHLISQVRKLAQTQKLITFRRTNRWGLGNEMFALASTWCISRHHSGVWTVCLDPLAEVRRAFDLDTIPNCNADILVTDLKATVLFEEHYAVYDPIVQNVSTDTHLVLDRFFQSWRYFIDCETDVRRLFTFTSSNHNIAKKRLVAETQKTLKCASCFDDVITIGVHVRRGNMATDPELIAKGYKVADIGYIDRALNNLTNSFVNKHKPVAIVVVSDDITWCISNLSHHKNVVYISTDDAVLDLAVMSQCQYVVMTVGTFGWWSGWLAHNRTVLYFADWPEKGSQLDQATSRSDYFPPKWIGLT